MRTQTTRVKEKTRPRGMALDLAEAGEARLLLSSRITFPCTQYQTNPRGYFHDILGAQPWARSYELIDAVANHNRVAVKAGRKLSKSWTIAGLALWFYSSFPDARVIMTSTTAQQVERVLWIEISKLHARSGKCLACKIADPNNVRIPRPCPHSALIDGEIGQLAYTGLKIRDTERGDFREIFGFTAKQGEAVQGMSGSRMLYIVDEASGIPDFIYEAIEGNRAGGAKIILTGNPTQNVGEFYDAFHSKKLDESKSGSTGYKCLTISSEESPNVVERREVIPGLATTEFIEERKKEWGENSSLYKIHIKGEFAENEEGRAFSVLRLKLATERLSETPASGLLHLGVDPAGPSGTGDDSAFVLRRGLRVLRVDREIGMSASDHRAKILSLLAAERLPREVPVVVMDQTGSVGAELYGSLCGYLNTIEEAGDATPFTLVGLRSSDNAHREPHIYDTLRDELAGNLSRWIDDGGALPDDVKLQAELHCLEWRMTTNRLQKITPKDEIKKRIGRSPDSSDALQLACWDSGEIDKQALPKGAAVDDDYEEIDQLAEDFIDPYAGK